MGKDIRSDSDIFWVFFNDFCPDFDIFLELKLQRVSIQCNNKNLPYFRMFGAISRFLLTKNWKEYLVRVQEKHWVSMRFKHGCGQYCTEVSSICLYLTL